MADSRLEIFPNVHAVSSRALPEEILARRLATNVGDALLEKGFRLAHFLVHDRDAAMTVLKSAVSTLAVQHSLERKRRYWRAKNLKRRSTRVTRNYQDILQWLICVEADRHAQAQARLRSPEIRDLAVQYIQNITTATTAMSSFYVAVGTARLVHSYSTHEIGRIYESLTDQYPGDDQYRRAKNLLMSILERRFGNLLNRVRGRYREARFQISPNQDLWRALAEKCFVAFTPWSTQQACPARARDTKSGGSPPARDLSGQGRDAVEIYRCHTLLCPECFRHLTLSLRLPPPEVKLALPLFQVEKYGETSWPDECEPLSTEDLIKIRCEVSERRGTP